MHNSAKAYSKAIRKEWLQIDFRSTIRFNNLFVKKYLNVYLKQAIPPKPPMESRFV